MLLVCMATNAWLINSDLGRYIPMMISRMIMSLKEVASSRETHLVMDIPSALPMNLQDSYAPHRVESIRLSTLK